MLEETSPAEVSEHVRERCGCARTEDEIGPEARWAQDHVEAVPPPRCLKITLALLLDQSFQFNHADVQKDYIIM